jgi:hypothetical protein
VTNVLLHPECYLYCRGAAVRAHRGNLPEGQIVADVLLDPEHDLYCIASAFH